MSLIKIIEVLYILKNHTCNKASAINHSKFTLNTGMVVSQNEKIVKAMANYAKGTNDRSNNMKL